MAFTEWWTKGAKGYAVEPRYGSKRIQLSVMGSIIQTGDKLSDVKAVLELLIDATTTGELDKALLAVSDRKENPKTGTTERKTRGH